MGGCFSGPDVQTTGKQGGLATSGSSQYVNEADKAVSLLTGSANYSSMVDIHVTCKNLMNRDIGSKSDPMAVLYTLGKTGWQELRRTEVISDTLSPEFVKALRTTYNFEKVQRMKVMIYDVDTSRFAQASNIDLRGQDYLGEADFVLSELITAPSKNLTKTLTHPKRASKQSGATVTLTAEEATNQNALVRICFAAEGLENKDTLGKSDPFVKVSRAREDGTFAPVLKTEVKNNNLNPTWEPFDITIQQLCNGDVYRPLKVEVYDWDRSGSHDLIGGTANTSLSALQGMAGGAEGLDLVNPAKQSKPGYKRSGRLLIKKIEVTPRPSFLDYIAGGCEISFLVAIDFTASNGAPSQPNSLHFLDAGGRPTPYEQAIMAIGGVLEFYDTDKAFPTWGFGGQLGPGGGVSHCFALNGNGFQPEVRGVQGILTAYRQALSAVTLSGPTLFEHVVRAASNIAAQPSQRQKYYVLLILTDGAIMDMQPTVKALVEAADLPVSVLIVGVGAADFTAMQALDGDKARLAYNGRKASRDIVQFVPYTSGQPHDPEELAAQLLAEVPGQFLQYWQARGIQPHAPPAAPPAAPAPVA